MPNTIEIPIINSKKLFLESYGCAMNFSDSEIVASILETEGYITTKILEEADLVLINTCAIREKAEQTVRKRLTEINVYKKTNKKLMVGVLGCMAERLKEKFLEEEKIVDMVVGPDAYRDLPNLIKEVEGGQSAVNVILSKDETYADVNPIRLSSNGVTALVTITRGCDNMCTFCVVPFTRGRERSRDPYSILSECKDLAEKGYKEITLLGQNVDSYLWFGGGLKKDFKTASPLQQETSINFAKLLEMVAIAIPQMRLRFSTSNPHDMGLEVLQVVSKYPNICKHIHLPVQSGSTSMLKRMNRQHSREEYITLIDNIKKNIPNCAISHDMIVGFCGETDQEHTDTMSLIDYVQYDFGYMYAYSERPGTPAEKKLKDDVPADIKQKRLAEIVALQRSICLTQMQKQVGEIHQVLVEGESKKSNQHWSGRNQRNNIVVFPKESHQIGDFVAVLATSCTSATLIGKSIDN